MRSIMKLAVFTGAMALLVGLAGTGTALADTVSGTMTGDRGGNHVSWDVTLAEDAEASLELAFWPCINPNAIQLEVWGADGMLGMASQDGACTKSLTWNTGSGGDATVRLSNYLHGVGTQWSLTTENVDLPAAEGEPDMADTVEQLADETEDAIEDELEEPSGMVEEVADEADDAAEEMAEVGAEVVEEVEDTAAALGMTDDPAAAADGQEMTGTLLGNVGGAFATYQLPVQEGETYNLRMTRGLDVGGNWPGVGFKVWGPDGLVASSAHTYGEPATATFTADQTGTYQIQVYNYHHGRTLFYAFDMVADGSDDSM